MSPHDLGLYTITDSSEVAVDEIRRFYANYHSIRNVGKDLVIRLQHEPTDEQIAELDEDFRHLVSSGSIRRVGAYDVERRQDDVPDLPRIAMAFNQRGYAELRALIDRVNSWVSPAS